MVNFGDLPHYVFEHTYIVPEECEIAYQIGDLVFLDETSMGGNASLYVVQGWDPLTRRLTLKIPGSPVEAEKIWKGE